MSQRQPILISGTWARKAAHRGLHSSKHEALGSTGSLYVLNLCLDPAGPTLLCKGRGCLQSLPHAPSALYPNHDMLVHHHVPFLPARPGCARATLAAPGVWREDPPCMHSVTPPKPKCSPAPRSPWPRYTKGTGGCIKVGISLGPGWCELGERWWFGGHCGRVVPPCAPLRALQFVLFPSLSPRTLYVVCAVRSLHLAPLPLSTALHLVRSDQRGGVGVCG